MIAPQATDLPGLDETFRIITSPNAACGADPPPEAKGYRSDTVGHGCGMQPGGKETSGHRRHLAPVAWRPLHSRDQRQTALTGSRAYSGGASPQASTPASIIPSV